MIGQTVEECNLDVGTLNWQGLTHCGAVTLIRWSITCSAEQKKTCILCMRNNYRLNETRVEWHLEIDAASKKTKS